MHGQTAEETAADRAEDAATQPTTSPALSTSSSSLSSLAPGEYLPLYLTYCLQSPHRQPNTATLHLAHPLLRRLQLRAGQYHWLQCDDQRILVQVELLLAEQLLYCQPLTVTPPDASDAQVAICPVLQAQLRAGWASLTLSQQPIAPSAVVQAEIMELRPLAAAASTALAELAASVSSSLLPLFLQSACFTAASLLSCDQFDQPQQYSILSVLPAGPSHTVYTVTADTVIRCLPALTVSASQSAAQLPSPQAWLAAVKEQLRGYNSIVLSIAHAVCGTLQPPSSSPLLPLLCPPRVFLLHGLPGTGKTRLAQLVNSASCQPTFSLSAADLFHRLEGEGEAALDLLFSQAREAAATQRAAWVVIDEVDAMCGDDGAQSWGEGEEEEDGGIERGLVQRLCQLLDAVHSSAPPLPVFVLLLTNRLTAVSASLLRNLRVDRQLHLSALGREARLEVLQLYSRRMKLQDETEGAADGAEQRASRLSLMQRINSRLHGYVGADVEKLCREVSMQAIARCGHDGQAEDCRVTEADFAVVLRSMRPANLSELEHRMPADVAHSLESAASPFDSLAGLDDVIAFLRRNILEPLLASLESSSASAQSAALPLPSGLLLYGLSGVGKTSLALALGVSSSLPLLLIQSTSLVSAVVGETEKNLSALFSKARDSSPCCLVIDQLDSIAASRGGTAGGDSYDRLVACLLQELDGIGRGRAAVGGRQAAGAVFIIATTAVPDLLDAALLRPGRLDCHVLLPKPDRAARAAVLRKAMSRMPVRLNAETAVEDIGDAAVQAAGVEELIDRLSVMTDGCSGADLTGLVREAGLHALRRGKDDVDAVRSVGEEDFLGAARATHPSLKSLSERYPPGTRSARSW